MVQTTIWQSIAETPWWIYILVVYCLWLTYQASRPRVLTIQTLYLLPSLFTGLSFLCMGAASASINLVTFSAWALMVLMGAGLSYLHFQFLKVKAYKNQHNLYFPGTYIPVMGVIIGFATKWYYHYSLAFDLLDLAKPHNLVLLLIIYGFLTGIFFGRLSYALRCIKEGPYLEGITTAV